MQPELDNSTDSSDTKLVIFQLTEWDALTQSYSVQPKYNYYRQPLVKQTYSVFVATHNRRRKWHLSTVAKPYSLFLVGLMSILFLFMMIVAYFTQDTVDQLGSIEDHPQLRRLSVPMGLYVCARSAKGRPRHSSSISSIGNFPIPTHPVVVSMPFLSCVYLTEIYFRLKASVCPPFTTSSAWSNQSDPAFGSVGVSEEATSSTPACDGSSRSYVFLWVTDIG